MTYHPAPGDSFMGQEILADDDPRAAIMENQPWVAVELHQHPITGQIGMVVCGPFDTNEAAEGYGRWLITHSPPHLQPKDVSILQMVVDPRILDRELDNDATFQQLAGTKPDKILEDDDEGVCDGCASGMMVHVHCDKCGCTADPECDYGGWHDLNQHRPGCARGCENSTCPAYDDNGRCLTCNEYGPHRAGCLNTTPRPANGEAQTPGEPA